MAEGDSEIVFGRGHSALSQEPQGGVNLFDRGDTRESMHMTDQVQSVTQQPLLESTPRANHADAPIQEDHREGGRNITKALAKMVFRPEIYDGTSDWEEYISHFSDCAELGSWNDHAKCLVLAANLRGAARKYYTGLRVEEKKDYHRLLGALKRRFGGEHRQDSWLARLEMRKKKPDESISDLGDDIWQMTQRAYHDFDYRSQEQLALKHFYRLLDADMKVKCIENRCNNILDAVYVVERYEALYADRKENKKSTLRAVEVKSDVVAVAMQKIIEELDRLAVRQDKMEEQSQRTFKSMHAYHPQGNVTCFLCGEKGHYRSNCPRRTGSDPGNREHRHGNFHRSNWRAKVW